MHVHTCTCEHVCACMCGAHTGHGDVAVNCVEVCVQVHCGLGYITITCLSTNNLTSPPVVRSVVEISV